MIITELEDGGLSGSRGGGEIVKAKAKRALVGAGARILFYPTLLYNLIRNKTQAEFRWWDEVDQFILLGAVPFPMDVPLLQQIGVRGVITLNEPYETLVPSSLYKVHGIDHLVIPTRDYLFAPSLVDISRAVDFIHRNASHGRKTYVHCKAGRGRSTTIVLCYLVEYKHMTPTAALEYVRSRRPRVLLAPSQWQAVQEYSRRKLEYPAIQSPRSTLLLTRDDVLITAEDLEGYDVDDDAKCPIISSFENIRERPMVVNPISAADVKDNDDDDGDDDAEYQIISYEIVQENAVVVNHTPKAPEEWDEVLITEEDMEGYESCKSDRGDIIISSDSAVTTNSPPRRLSCLFSSLKFSAGGQPVASSLHEIHA